MQNASDPLFIILMMLLVTGTLVVALVVVYLSGKAHQRAWTELAERTGLTFEPGPFLFAPPRVTGCIAAARAAPSWTGA